MNSLHLISDYRMYKKLLSTMKKSKYVEYFKRKLFVMGYKHFDVNQMTDDIIKVSKSDISYFPFSHNTIKMIRRGNDVTFFRECLYHGDFKSRIDLCCKEFLEMLHGKVCIVNFNQEIPLRTQYSEKEVSEFEIFLKLWKKNGKFYKELRYLDYYKKKSGFSIWRGHKHLSSQVKKKLAIPPLENNQEELLTFFLIFISSYIESWLFHEFLGKDEYETFFASRSLATYKLASILGVSSLVSDCKFVKVLVEGNPPSYGVLCELAPGIRGLDSQEPATPEIQREFSKLSMLDALTYETDHFANNYNVVTTLKGAVGVCAFDNDSKWTLFPNPYTPRNTARGGSGLLMEGKISLQYVDKELAETIIKIDEDQLKCKLSFYLNDLQIWALISRLKLLRKALRKNNVILLEAKQFNSDTMERELSTGVCSYLYQYVHREELNLGYMG